jgi:hypothetical protein
MTLNKDMINEAAKILRVCAKSGIDSVELRKKLKPRGSRGVETAKIAVEKYKKYRRLLTFLEEGELTNIRTLRAKMNPKTIVMESPKMQKLKEEIDELKPFRKFIPIIQEMEIKDVRILKRRLEESDARLKSLKEEGTEVQIKAIKLLERGTTEEQLCEELYGASSVKSVMNLKGILSVLRRNGLIIYSMGRGPEKKYQLEPFKEIKTPYIPPVPTISVEKCENYNKLFAVFDAVSRKKVSRKELVKRFGEENFDNLIKILFDKGLVGAKNIEGEPIYHTRSSKYEFDAHFLKKVISGIPEKDVSKRMIIFIKNNPGCTREQIAKSVYGTSGSDSQSRELKKASLILSQTLKGVVRIEKKGHKSFYFFDGELKT